MKKLLAILLCVVMVLSLAACGGQDDVPTPDGGDDAAVPDGSNNAAAEENSASLGSAEAETSDDGKIVSARDTLNVAISGDTGNLDKCTSNFAQVSRQFYEPLFSVGPDGETIWVLATGIDEVSDTEWIVHLREGVTFSNGSAFDANDVLFSFKMAQASSGSKMTVEYLDLEKSEVIDPYTLKLCLTTYSITQMGSLTEALIRDAETFDETTAVTNPIGTGPYVVEEYVMNSHLHLKANENYWGGKAYIENLNYVIITEDAQIVNGLQTGTIDVCMVPGQDVEYVKSLPDFAVAQYSSKYCPTLKFNHSSNSVFNSLDARLAVCYATDRQAMIDLAYFGYADLLHYPVTQQSYDFTPDLADLHDVYATGYNLEKAKEYAEKAGLVGKEITIITNGASQFVTEAEILQANLKDIGVTAKIDNYDAASFFTVSGDPTNYDIILFAVSSPQCLAAGLMYQMVLWSPTAFDEWENYEAFTALGAQAMGTSDETVRAGILKEMSQMFVDGIPWYGICDQMTSVAANKALVGEAWSTGAMLFYAHFNEWYWTE